MDLSYTLDILFMLLAFLAVRHTMPSLAQINNTEHPSTPRNLTFDHLNSPSTPSASASGAFPRSPASPFGRGSTSLLSPQPRRDSLAVPQITLTPDLLRGGIKGATRPKHGRKSVSFSLSSMDELMAKRESKKRPPTPFNRSYLGHGPIDDGEGENEVPVPPLPKAVEQMRASPDARDAMGVKKGWLMPRGSV